MVLSNRLCRERLEQENMRRIANPISPPLENDVENVESGSFRNFKVDREMLRPVTLFAVRYFGVEVFRDRPERVNRICPLRISVGKAKFPFAIFFHVQRGPGIHRESFNIHDLMHKSNYFTVLSRDIFMNVAGRWSTIERSREAV
jgi:hypothetical protein